VSTPLRWSEVHEGLDPSRFTVRTLPERLRDGADDPLRPVLSERPDLVSAIGRLQERLDRG
jgi:bifunctional non-homologous end joining protein LigD